MARRKPMPKRGSAHLTNVAHHNAPGSGIASSSSHSGTPRTVPSTCSDSGGTSPMPTSSSIRELSDGLIKYISQQYSTSKPPRKKHKTALGQNAAGENGVELDHIVVNHCTWDIDFLDSKLSNLEFPLVRNGIRLDVHWTSRNKAEYIEIRDDFHKTVFHTPLPEDKDIFQDIQVALKVNRGSRLGAKTQGKLWTDFGIELLQEKGQNVMRLHFKIKWNTTATPYEAVSSFKKTQTLMEVLNRYFPDPQVTKGASWSPQDFYQSVYCPDRNDQISQSLEVKELKSDLFPFQKRSVQWLLKREGVEWSNVSKRITPSNTIADSTLPLSFILAHDASGRPCFVSHLFGLVTLDVEPFRDLERNLYGGILAEEMGLGKTVEIISLITLHRRSRYQKALIFDLFTGANVRPITATLIIAPPAISLQWISEINKHAPHLKIAHYQGISVHNETMSASEIEELLASSDVVVSTYSVLASEIHFTQLNPEKTLRTQPKYPRPKSPLMGLQFYRVVMDEAQMIESGVSKAAVVARMVPRVNAWCVTGTPVRKDMNDLLGLLVFLRYEPFASTKHIWSSFISSHKNEFRKLFSILALRHSKISVRDELKLPPQRRYVITMPFTPVEEQHYHEMFSQMCEELNLDLQGTPLEGVWESKDYVETMRKWLVRLRQTALHPEVGGRNRRALGHKDGPLRTVDQVLDVMIEQADVTVRTEQRTLLAKKLKRGQLFENSPKVNEALEIWTEAANEAHAIVEETRQQLLEETSRNLGGGEGVGQKTRPVSGDDSDGSGDDEEIEGRSRLGTLRSRVRSALEMEHIARFFIANAHFQIKTNEEMTKPGSPEFEELEKLEVEGYDTAKRLRREILQDIYNKADKLMRKLSKKASSQAFVQIPPFPSSLPKGGLESRRIIEQLHELGEALDIQASQLDEWREETIKFLLRPLVDEDNEVEITGDEYEESTKTQDEVMVYVQALRATIADRHDALSGQENKLTKYDVDFALRMARDGEGVFPQKTIELLSIRERVKPPKEIGFVRRVVAELRGLATTLRQDVENGNARAQAEHAIVDKQLKSTQKLLSEHTKVTVALEKEIDVFAALMNTRLEYYKQLQQVSDMVAPYEGANNPAILALWLKEEDKLKNKLAQAKSKRRYLQHLKAEAASPQEQRICVICREGFEVGALTVCGHQYCKECIHLWWSAHRNCPVCKKKLIQADLHEITYKPQELTIQAEEVQSPSRRRNSSSTLSKKSAIYSEISTSKLAEIKKIDLDGPSFTTKVDTLARHLIWLRETDPGAKSIIYSQFKDFLDVLALAFKRFRIGYSSIDKPNGIEKFKEDPSVECFLLHARAHSSGLNLVNASHVFLCEPLLNTALELQAIARVDRIGQHQETNVWLYLVDGTVEESIHSLSVKRRMQHITHHTNCSDSKGKGKGKGKGKAREVDENEVMVEELEEANSMEMQQASLSRLFAKGGGVGEMVEEEDLWECLFGGRQRGVAGGERTLEGLDRDVDRHLRAEATDMRRIERLRGGG